ncbi:hypothetical protein XM25_19303 [Devosia sp. H5989]|nr:hypothetical protein XM25_19303 [Devosia sp. H5989]
MDFPRALAVLLLALAVSVSPVRASWERGLAEYEAGQFEEALSLLLPLAEADDVRAQEIVADMYFFGQGTEPNSLEGLRWSRRAAALGSGEAENDLGVAYALGDQVEQDDAEALRWFLKAAAHGNAKAQISLAKRYLYGLEGVSRDVALGLRYLEAAVSSDHPRALTSLAQLTEQGAFGLRADRREAFRLLERAAEQRFAPAQMNLGFHYAMGIGVRRDPTRAITWFMIAAKGGCIRAAQMAEPWVAGHTDKAVETVRRLVAEWEAAHPPRQRRNANDLGPDSSCAPIARPGALKT